MDYVLALFLPVAIGGTLAQVPNETANITIGVIVDSRRTAAAKQTDVSVTNNVNVVWQYANYSEIFHVFRAVRRLDMNLAVDVIVVTDYTPSLLAFDNVLEPNHKGVIKLAKSTTDDYTEMLHDLKNQYFSDDWVPTMNPDSEPVCKRSLNVSTVSSSDVLIGDTITTAPPQILARLVRLQDWMTVHVFYDTGTERETQILVDSLSSYGVAVSLFNVDVISDMHEVLEQIYDVAVTSKPEIYGAVLCRLDCLLKVFDAANSFDRQHKETNSLLSIFSRWLAVVYNYNSQIDELLQTVVGNLNNVAMVVVPELTPIPYNNIISYLRPVVAEATALYPNETRSQEFLIGRIKGALLTWDRASICGGYVIMTLLLTTTGRRFTEVGHAFLDTSLHMEVELFPNIKYGFSDRSLKVVTIPYPPFIVKTEKNGTTEYGGICMELLMEISKVLNFTYTLVEPPDNNYGSVDGTVNGTYIFNGMIGMLQRHEMDVAVAPLAIMPERETVSDFGYEMYYEYTTVLLKKPDPNLYKWRTLLDPFKLNVLLYIGVSLLSVTVAVFILEKYNAYYAVPAHAAKRRDEGGLHTLIDSAWYIYGALLCQGGARLPDSFAGRTIVSAWWIFCIVIVGTYCGNLIAFLTVTKNITPFNNLEEMIALKDQYTWGCLGGTNWQQVFMTSELPDFRKVGDAMIEFNKTDPGTFHTNINYHIQRVKTGGYAFIADETYFEMVMSTDCELTRIKEEFLPIRYSFAFQKKSPLTSIFSEQIKNAYEAGLIDIWKRKWWPKENICLTSNMPQATPISLSDVQSAHYACALGIVVGTLAFVTEVIVFRCRKRRDGESAIANTPEAGQSQTTDMHEDTSISSLETKSIKRESNGT